MLTMSTSKQSGSAILNDFRAAMQYQRSGGAKGPVMRRNFTASNTDRMAAGWITGGMSINALIESSLEIMRERSRNWYRNDEHGRRFSTLVKNGVVGADGITLKMRCGEYIKTKDGYKFNLDTLANQAIESAWKKWCQRGNCEVTGRFSFTDLCRLNIDMAARDGEYITRRVRGGRKNPYQLQVLATERLDIRRRNSSGVHGTDTRMGVERDSTGRPVAYHVLAYTPSDPQNLGSLTSLAPERVLAKDVFHDFITMDAEQLRGVPWAHAVLMGAHLLHGFEESAVFAARVGASHMGFFTQPPGQGAPLTPNDLGANPDAATDKLMTDVEPGALDLLPPGIDFKSFDARYPSEAFAPFTQNRKHSMASGLDVTYHALTGDMTKVNYSSARIAELAERDNWRSLQQWFISGFVHPAFKDWLEMSLLAGAITLPNGSALPATKLDRFLEGAAFQPRGWDWVDPVNDAQAAKLAREEGLTTRTKSAAARGGDFEDNVIELAMEQELLAKHKVTLGDPTKPVAGKPGASNNNTTKPADPGTDPAADPQDPPAKD